MASSFSLTSKSYDGRYLKLSCTQTKDIASNTSTIKWTLTSAGGNSNYYSIGPTTVKINGTTVYDKRRVDWYEYIFPAKTGSTSGTIKVTHNSTGDKSISVSLTTAIYTYAETTKSGTWTLDDIPRQATISSAPNFNDEENPTITYSNPAGTSVTTLQACIADDKGNIAYVPYRDISKSGTSYTFKLDDADRDALRKAAASSNSIPIKFYIRTTFGDTKLYSKISKTLTIVNNQPVFTSDQLSYADTDATVTKITGDPLMIVQNKSNLKVTYKAATAKKSATISKYTFTLNGITKTSTTAGGTIDFGKINSEKDLTLSVKVIDSRGNSVSATKTINCYKYYSPSFLDFKAYRANANGKIDSSGTYLKCEYITNIASVNGKNARTIKIEGVGSTPITVDSDSYLINLNGDKSSTYNIQATVKDSFGGSAKSVSYTIYGDSRIINISPDGTGIAFGKKVESSEQFECLWDASFLGDVSILGNVYIKNKLLFDVIHPVGSVHATSTNTNPSSIFGGTWALINKSFSSYAGINNDFFTAESNISSASCAVVRNDSTIRIRLKCTLEYNVTDTTTLIGTFNWNKIGINGTRYAFYQYPAGCDGGAATILCEIGAEEGKLYTVEAIGHNQGNSTTGNHMYLDITIPIKAEDMIDSFCNTFYWERIA